MKRDEVVLSKIVLSNFPNETEQKKKEIEKKFKESKTREMQRMQKLTKFNKNVQT
jgi:hypothetical protein